MHERYSQSRFHLDSQPIPKAIHRIKGLYNLTTDDIVLLDTSILAFHYLIERPDQVLIALRKSQWPRVWELLKDTHKTVSIKQGATTFTFVELYPGIFARGGSNNDFRGVEYQAGMYMQSLGDLQAHYENVLNNPRTSRKRQEEIQNLMAKVGTKWNTKNPAY